MLTLNLTPCFVRVLREGQLAECREHIRKAELEREESLARALRFVDYPVNLLATYARYDA